MQLRRTIPKTLTTATLQEIPNGSAGTKATLRKMAELIRLGKKTLPIRLLALDLTKHLRQKDWAGEIASLHRYVRDNIRYVKDINGVETLHTPEKILELKQGDCDDKSILLASLLESIGHPARIVAIGISPFAYCHVLVETKLRNKWVPLETTEPVNPGWYPKNVVKRMVVHI